MTGVPNPLGLSQLEIASNLVLGAASPASHLPRRGRFASARIALEAAVQQALERTPCVVSFSGGRDSSAVLALAVHVARREGLELPIAVTLRFPGVDQADETAWQELVVRHLGVEEWERVEVGEELDMLGPYAQDVLKRCGLLWPANSYVHEPILRRAELGSLITGVDGDGVLGSWRWQAHADVASGRRARSVGNLVKVAHAASPRPVRSLVARRHEVQAPLWLRPDAARAFVEAVRREHANEPFSWGRRVRWLAQRKYLHLVRSSFETMARAHSVEVTHLFIDPGFLRSLADHSRFGPGDRTAAMRELFGDVLPEAVLSRRTKAVFGRSFASGQSREFIAGWSGGGLNEEIVDGEVLSRVWKEDADPGRQSMLLLQSVWLASSAQRS